MAQVSEAELRRMEEIMRSTLHRHFVAIYVEITGDNGKVMRSVFSGFLMSLNGRWIVGGAGHCFDRVQYHVDRGRKAKRCYLFYSPARVSQPVAFDWERQRPWFRFEQVTGIDYGALFLDDQIRGTLQAGDKYPLDESLWDRTDSDADWYVVYGVPESRTELTETAIEMTTMFYPLEAVTETPDLSYEPKVKTFFGRLRPGVGSVVGVSGGPIFANRKAQYWLHAVQSWQRGKLIGAPLVRPMGLMLREEIARRW